jgi:hypothetical protein
MGTRCVVTFIDRDLPIASVFHTYDGYPEGVGKDLAEFLAGVRIINGMTGCETLGAFANGVACLAAQYIREVKTSVGGVYMINVNADQEEYNYNVSIIKSNITITVELEGRRPVFSGSPEMFLKYLEECEEND